MHEKSKFKFVIEIFIDDDRLIWQKIFYFVIQKKNYPKNFR